MIKKKTNTNGEPLTLNELMTELNNLFASHKDDPKATDIKSMIKSLVNGEACFEEQDEEEGIDISNEDLSGSIIGHGTLWETVDGDCNIMTKDINGEIMPVIAFVSTESMMEGVVDTIRAMTRPTIVGKECPNCVDKETVSSVIIKAAIACGEKREAIIKEHGYINGFVFDENNGGMCRLSINRKDGYDFIVGENKNTRFIIFDETVCPATIPTDIISDDRKWGKRMTSELPKLIEQRIEESKSNENKLPFADAVKPALTKIDIPNLTEKKSAMCNFPAEIDANDALADYRGIKKPIIADIMKDFAEAKNKGKVGDDTFVEFMKPENKEVVTKAVESALYENAEDDFTDEDTNPDCFRCVAEYMAKECVDSVHFWTDEDGLIHCDVKIKTVYKVEMDDSDKK